MKSKKIGIVGWNISENSFGVTKAYAYFLSHFGNLVTLHPQEGIVEDLDLLVLPGGQDVSSHIYGQVPSYYNTNADLMKEFFMKNNLPQYIEAGVPVFGICLGMQQIYTHFGGSLIQELGDHPRSAPNNRGEEVHGLVFEPNYVISGKHKVNSLHHQGCDPETKPDCIDIVAYSSCKGKEQESIEIIRHTELPIWGVQYHPEEIFDAVSRSIINTLLKNEFVKETV